MKNIKVTKSINVHTGLFFLSALILVGATGCTKRPTVSPAAKSTQASLDKLIQTATASPTSENYINLGLEYSRLGRSQDALELYNRAVVVDPKSPIGWNNICSEYNVQSRFADAIPNCEQAVALDPKFTLAQNNLAMAKEKLKEHKKIVLERNKNWSQKANLSSNELISIGMDFYIVRELDAANQAWGQVKKGDPLYAQAQNNLASAFILLGKLSAAEKALGEALKLEPKNQLFGNNKAWLERQKLAHMGVGGK